MRSFRKTLEVRERDLLRFYKILAALERKVGGTRKLADCTGRGNWPRRGVYFFQEPGEFRPDTGDSLRIVRVGVGPDGVRSSSRTLWDRLHDHKGFSTSSGGNHRGSIFRRLVGESLMNRDDVFCPSWKRGIPKPRSGTKREIEEALERKVRAEIGAMPFLWIAVEDEAGPESMRSCIERNTIALLSNYQRPPLDSPSDDWLGSWCSRTKVKESGLWNNRHVDERYQPQFLDTLEAVVGTMRES